MKADRGVVIKSAFRTYCALSSLSNADAVGTGSPTEPKDRLGVSCNDVFLNQPPRGSRVHMP